MRTKTANKLFSLLAAALMVVSNISPVRVLAEGETPVVTWNGTGEETHVTVGEEIDFLAGVSATDGEGNELKVEIKGVTSDDESFVFEGQASLVATKAEVSYVVTYEALKDETPLDEGSKTFFIDKENEGNIEESTDPLSNTESQEETEKTSEEQPQETPAVLGANRNLLGNGGPSRAGGPTITATIVDETGAAIDFSSGTSGTEATFVHPTPSQIGKLYTAEILVDGLSSSSTNKRVEIDVPVGMDMLGDGRDDKLEEDLELTKGDNGIESVDKRLDFYLPNGNGLYPKLNTFAGTKIYYLQNGVTTLPIKNLNIKVDPTIFNVYINKPLSIRVYENDVLVAETTLEKALISGTPIHSEYEVTTGVAAGRAYTPYISFRRMATSRDGVGHAIINEYKHTFTVSDPNVKLKFILSPAFGDRMKLDESRASEGIYVIYSDNSFNKPFYHVSYNYLYGFEIPSTYNTGDSFSVKIDGEVDYYDSDDSVGNSRKVTKTYTDKFNIIDEVVSVSTVKRHSPLPSGANQKIDYHAFGTAFRNDGNTNINPGYVVFEFDNLNSVGVRGLYTNFLNQITGEPEVVRGEHIFDITTTSGRTYTQTVNITDEQRYSSGSYSNYAYINPSDLGLNDNEYIKRIKFDVAQFSNGGASSQRLIDFIAEVFDTSKTIDYTIKYVENTSAGERIVLNEQHNLALDNNYFYFAGSSLLNRETGLESPVYSAGKNGKFRIDIYTKAINPFIYMCIDAKDGDGNYLKIKNFEIAASTTNANVSAQIFKNIDMNDIDERVVEGVGRVYKLDTEKIGSKLGISFDMANQDINNTLIEYRMIYINGELEIPLGTPTHTQNLKDLLFIEDRLLSHSDAAYSIFAERVIANGMKDGVSDRNTASMRYANVSGRSVNAYTISPMKTISVASSAKHESSDEYIIWNPGDEPIAVGNKSSFDIKVDVVNSSESTIPGETVVYVPIPKKGEDWKSLLEDDEGNKYEIQFSTKLNRVVPVNIPSGVNYTIEYGEINASDNNVELENQASRFSNAPTDRTNIVKITLRDLPANAVGTPDMYSFVLNCETQDVTEEGLVNTYRPLFKRSIDGAVNWPRGSMLSLETALGEVRGQVFVDDNKNGKLDAAENLAQAGIELKLFDANNNEIGKKTTDANGEYLFVDIKTKDEYTIRVTNPDANAYEFAPTGTANAKGRYNTDNQFSALNGNVAEGLSTTVYPAMAGSDGKTPATYNVGLMDANAVTTFTFDANGGQFSAGTASQTSVEVEGKSTDRVQAPANPERTGYEFAGWDPQVPSTFGYEDKTFKAQWNKAEYTITYNLDGGTNHDDNPTTYTVDDAVTLKKPTKEGYDFVEWKDEAGNATTGIAKGSTGNKTFTASWNEKTYTVNYVTGGGTSIPPRTDVKWTEANFKPANDPTLTGKKFEGWTLPNGTDYTGQAYKDVVDNDGVKSVTLTAKWSDVEYTVKYVTGQGSTTIPDKKVKWSDTGLTNGIPEKAGYKLKGWKTEAGSLYANEAYSALADNDQDLEITLTAEWEAKNYTVEFVEDGGTPVNDKTVKFDEANLTEGVTTTKKGFTFVNWFIDKAKTTVYNIADAFSKLVNGDDTKQTAKLYADWKEKIYTVHYQDKDGNTIASDNTVSFGDKGLNPTNNPEKTGYTFKGWYKDQALTQAYNNDSYAELVGDDDTKDSATLYGKFEQNQFTVELDPNGGQGYMAPLNVKYEDGTTAPTITYTRKGYNPDGWNTAPDGTGVAYAVGADISKLAERDGQTVKLYAQWKIINYDINYVWNDDDPSVSKVTNKTDTTLFPVTYTVEDAITLGTPIRDGYTFKGWKPSDKIEKGTTGELTFTAEWEVIEYKITYDLNKGTGSTDPVNATSNPDTYTIEREVTLADPTREGYTFKEWTPTNKIDKGSTGDKTFKAEWEANTYTISFSDEGADEGSAPADMNATFDTPLTAPDNTGNLKKKGHDFEGWEGPDGTIYKPGDELLNLTSGNGDTVTLKPVWESFTYSYTQGAGNVWTKGSNATSDFRVTRSRKDELTYGNFKEIKVDGVVVAASNYAASAGSVIVKLKPGYLQGLSNGNHTLETVLNDGSVSTTFTIKAKPQVNVVQPTARTCQDDGYPAGYYWNGTACVVGYGARVSTPNTGDGFNAWLYLSAGMTAMAIALFAALQLKKHTS